MLRILHAADLHLDSPFTALTPEQAAERRRLQRQLPEKLVDLCAERDCRLLLLAGDVFDGELVCPETLEAMRAAFTRCRARIFISPGNHDPYTPDSPWARTAWPEQVHIFTTQAWEPVTLPDLGCRVWGAAFSGREARELLRPVPARADGLLEIGVLHGDPENQGAYNPISARQLTECGLDYLALGHIHKTAPLRQAGRTWYAWPGAAMGRGFDETGVHGAYQVELDGQSCRASLLPLPGPRYVRLTVSVDGDPEEAVMAALPEDSGSLICRLTLTGEAEPFDRAALEARLESRFAALDLRDETVPPRDLWEGCGAQTLRGLTLQALKKQYDAAPDQEARQTAALAARYALAALEGREAP